MSASDGTAPPVAPPDAPPRLSGQAVASLVLGVAGVVPYTLGLASLPALLLGYRAVYDVNASDGRLRGRGLARAGMALGVVGLVVVAAWLVVIVSARLNANAARAGCKDNLRQIGEALKAYSDGHAGVYPPGTVPNAALPPERRLSWHAEVLPYLDRPRAGGPGRWQKLYASLDPAAAWDDPANKAAAATAVPRFVCPASPPDADLTLTTYVGLAGVGADAATLSDKSPRRGFFGYDRLLSSDDLTAKGSGHVLAVIETAEDNGPWLRGGPATVRGVAADEDRPVGRGRPFGGLHAGGANALWADGSVHFESEHVEPGVFRKAVLVEPPVD
jgi:prepilin-type processing-associated H-X9-DG protein